LLAGLTVPRPIALVTTQTADGRVDAAATVSAAPGMRIGSEE
jgi:flavin reductase (DIM6/NTAB) family NADH-FMN oxidoreductase RutF